MSKAKIKMKNSSIISQEIIENKIYLIRGKKVMLDSDLAKLYEIETKHSTGLSKETSNVSLKNLCFNYLKKNTLL